MMPEQCRNPECVAARRVVDAVVSEQLAAQATFGARGLAVGPAHDGWMRAWEARVGAVNDWLRGAR